jgi:hypothetical protein
MIELINNRLRFTFSEVHPDAEMTIEFQRTLRLPDDGKTYPLPPGLGRFPLRHVDDFGSRVPEPWRRHGGVMLPLFQSEAMWLNFDAKSGYPFLVKIAAGKINAVTGEEWSAGPNRDPQDYVVLPEQPWLDGYCFKKGQVRQFVAMPLGAGYSAEEQITGRAEVGGVQIVVHPMKGKVWQKILDARRRQAEIRARFAEKSDVCASMPMKLVMESCDMGLAPGGRMKQAIEKDPHAFDVWDLRTSSRCFAHLANSLHWRAITGEAPPTLPPTAADYSKRGLPWFDHYGEGEAVDGGPGFSGVESVADLGAAKGESPLPENTTATPEKIIVVGGSGKTVVRESDL